jgi:hypothetical protein
MISYSFFVNNYDIIFVGDQEEQSGIGDPFLTLAVSTISLAPQIRSDVHAFSHMCLS